MAKREKLHQLMTQCLGKKVVLLRKLLLRTILALHSLSQIPSPNGYTGQGVVNAIWPCIPTLLLRRRKLLKRDTCVCLALGRTPKLLLLQMRCVGLDAHITTEVPRLHLPVILPRMVVDANFITAPLAQAIPLSDITATRTMKTFKSMQTFSNVTDIN